MDGRDFLVPQVIAGIYCHPQLVIDRLLVGPIFGADIRTFEPIGIDRYEDRTDQYEEINMLILVRVN